MKRTSRNQGWLLPRSVLIFVCIIILFCIVLFRGALGSIVWRVMTPVLSHNPFGALGAQLQSKTALAGENDTLRAELASTTAALADRNVLYQENLELKARLDRDGSMHTILAGVILRPPATPYDTLTIDAGKAQGVAQGALVSAGGTTLIGEVDEVFDTTARVTLFSAPGQTYQALLTETDAHASVPISVQGQGNGSLVAEVPTTIAVQVGDSVIFPGVAGGLASTVVAVDEKSNQSFETVYMRLPVDPEQLRYVEVLKQ